MDGQSRNLRWLNPSEFQAFVETKRLAIAHLFYFCPFKTSETFCFKLRDLGDFILDPRGDDFGCAWDAHANWSVFSPLSRPVKKLSRRSIPWHLRNEMILPKGLAGYILLLCVGKWSKRLILYFHIENIRAILVRSFRVVSLTGNRRPHESGFTWKRIFP